jgi:hypothetical protein
MSHNASDAQKLISVDTVTVVPAVGSPFAVTKGLTASSPVATGVRHFQLPDPTTIPAGMSYEIKDSNGTAAGVGSNIVVMAPGSVTIDGSTDDDEITKSWGSKTYVNLGAAYLVRGDQLAVAGLASGGGSYLATFSGDDQDALPTGWSSTEVGTGIPWVISTDVFHSGGGNVSSAGSDNDPDSVALPAASGGSPAIATLTYSAGTLGAATVVSFQWLRDVFDTPVTGSGYYQTFKFYVNGLFVASADDPAVAAWAAYSYTIPSTGVYIFSWEWYRAVNYYDASRNNGCFVDTFEIT